jgi:hypothetical protein
MPNQLISPAAGLTADQIDRILNQMADSFGQQLRSPIWHSPSEASLDFEDVTFPSLDEVPLEGFIPAHRLFQGTGEMHEGQLWSKLTSNQSAAAAHCKDQSYIYSGGKAA